MAEPVDMSFVTTDVLGGTFLQWADPFSDVKDLVDKVLAKLKPGQCLRRLVIAGHGADHTTGFFVFDPDTTGIETIDGSVKKEPLGPNIEEQLARLRAVFCPDGIIELRVCQMGVGENGDRAITRIRDITGVAVTAPCGSISSLAAIGGLATDWKTIKPGDAAPTTSFWLGEGEAPPRPAVEGVAPVTGSTTAGVYVPMRTAAPTAATATATSGGSSWVRWAVAAVAVVTALAVVAAISAGGDRQEDAVTASATSSTTGTTASTTTTAVTTTAAPPAAAAANTPPTVTLLRSVLAVPVTTYTITFRDPDVTAPEVVWRMAGETCGTPKVEWSETTSASTSGADAYTASVRWSHSSDAPDLCEHDATDHDVTLSATVLDGNDAVVECVLTGSGDQELPDPPCR